MSEELAVRAGAPLDAFSSEELKRILTAARQTPSDSDLTVMQAEAELAETFGRAVEAVQAASGKDAATILVNATAYELLARCYGALGRTSNDASHLAFFWRIPIVVVPSGQLARGADLLVRTEDAKLGGGTCSAYERFCAACASHEEATRRPTQRVRVDPATAEHLTGWLRDGGYKAIPREHALLLLKQHPPVIGGDNLLWALVNDGPLILAGVWVEADATLPMDTVSVER